MLCKQTLQKELFDKEFLSQLILCIPQSIIHNQQKYLLCVRGVNGPHV
jgi:hypothetical protein